VEIVKTLHSALLIIGLAGFTAVSADAYARCEAPIPGRNLDQQILSVYFDIHGATPLPDPRRICTYYQLGQLYQFKGTYDKAIAAYTTAIALLSEFPDAYAARGDAYMDIGEKDKAAADYAKSQEMAAAEGPDDLDARCFVRAVRGRPLDLALADCNEAIRRDPSRPDYTETRALVYLRLGRYAEAIADGDAVIKAKPQLAGAWYFRGHAKLHLGDEAGGRADIAEAKKHNWRIVEDYEYAGVKF
jgi:tetratricopeptide (TPR) repeat protein